MSQRLESDLIARVRGRTSRRQLVWIWIASLLPGLGFAPGGLVAVLVGLALLGGAFTIPNAAFFATPGAVMDRTTHDGFVGVLLFGGGNVALLACGPALAVGGLIAVRSWES